MGISRDTCHLGLPCDTQGILSERISFLVSPSIVYYYSLHISRPLRTQYTLQKLIFLLTVLLTSSNTIMSVDTDIIIIGAGMSGVGMAIQLVRKFGTRSFEIIEKTSDIGGTWFVNSYPGCGCDVCSAFPLCSISISR